MTTKDKTTSPDLADHMGEVASNSQGHNTHHLPENQPHKTCSWCKFIAVCRERRAERELRERDEVMP